MPQNCRRYASSGEASSVPGVVEDYQDLVSESSFSTGGFSEDVIKAYDPVRRAQGRRRELPPSRYEEQL